VAHSLRLHPAELAIVIQRLRTHQDVPVILETNTFRASLCAGLEREDLREHSLTSLRKQYGLLCAHARHRMEATVASKAESSLLQVRAGAPLLLIEGETYGDDGQPVEHFKVLYRGDRFFFQFETDGAATIRLRQ
jgi:GntR family transcriptional regulator